MYQVQQIANLVPKVLSFALYNTIFAGVVDIFKYPRHQLIINEAANSRITFVFAAIIFSSSPPLFLAPRFWEPRDQPQPGFFLEARERILGTRFLFVYQSCLGHTSHDDIWCSVQHKYLFYKARCGQFCYLIPFTSRQNNSLDFYFSNMLINEHLTYSNHELAFIGQLY